MPAKKTPGSKGTDFSTLLGGQQSTDEKVQKIGILLEDVHSKMDLVLEKVAGNDQRSERMEHEIREVRQDMAMLGTVTQKNTKAIERLEQKIECVEQKIECVEQKIEILDTNTQKNTRAIETLTATVGHLEQKIDGFVGRLEHVEKQVA